MNWYLTVLRKYAELNGRARRMEYWMFCLFNWMAMVVLGLIEILLGGPGVLMVLYGFAVLVPTVCVTIRRLHDTGRSAWWLLTGFIPIFGGIIIFVLMLLDSEEGENIYGPNPKSFIV